MESNVEQLKMFDHYCTEHGSDLDIDGWDYSKIVLYLTVKIVRLHGTDAVHGRKDQLNTYPNSNYAAQLTHAAWDAAPYYDDDVYVRWECGCFNETKKDMEQRGRKMRNERKERDD